MVIVVDASCLFEVVTNSATAEQIRAELLTDDDWAAPHVVDVEVFSLIRRDEMRGVLDPTSSALAVDDLRAWPGERFGHRGLLQRAWQLRASVRGWDAAYVALAEALDAALLTLDVRLTRAPGPTCRFIIPPS